MDWMLILASVLLVLAVLRAEHLAAGVVWFMFWARSCYDEMDYQELDHDAPPEQVWPVYQRNHAGKLPYLFFAVKSFRLLIWSRAPGSGLLRARVWFARVVRPLWRFYTFVPLLAVALVWMAATPRGSQGAVGALLLATAFVLVLASLLIAVEASLSSLTLASWGRRHHSLIPSNSSALSEAGAVIISALVALVASFALVQVAVAAYRPYPELVGRSFASQLTFSALAALHAVHFEPPSGPGGVAQGVEAALTLLWLGYAVVLVAIFGAFIRPATAPPTSP